MPKEPASLESILPFPKMLVRFPKEIKEFLNECAAADPFLLSSPPPPSLPPILHPSPPHAVHARLRKDRISSLAAAATAVAAATASAVVLALVCSNARGLCARGNQKRPTNSCSHNRVSDDLLRDAVPTHYCTTCRELLALHRESERQRKEAQRGGLLKGAQTHTHT